MHFKNPGMSINKETYLHILEEVKSKDVVLVAVSKMQPVLAIKELYELGHRDFGENYVQELLDKQSQLPTDIRWHFIGHVQSNKIKYITPFVHLIHGIDSYKLLKEINKQAGKSGRGIDVLLQIHIAQEETKFGLDETALNDLVNNLSEEPLQNVRISGLMGMASFSDDKNKVRNEFRYLKDLSGKYDKLQTPHVKFQVLSMGMSDDYKIAIEEGSTMVRIGSLIFGKRSYAQ